MTENKVDIVIPFYNDSDKVWREIMYDYMKDEDLFDRQITGEERYRDWDNFKYFFRGIEKNCKWVNKIFLIVASETQIPKWLNRNNEKLKIVFHKDYIPNELLPTFNTMTIEIFIPLIKELSDNYIYCNDDYFFLNQTTKGMFFVDNYPVYKDTASEIKKFDTNSVDGTFYSILNNGIDLQLKISKDKAKWYALDHLPSAHKKNFEYQILKENYEDFIKANKTSRFRNKDKQGNHVYTCLYKDLKKYYKFDNYNNSCYVTITKDTDFNNFKNYQMVCFNDTQRLERKDFEETKQRLLEFLEKKLPNKSSFEK